MWNRAALKYNAKQELKISYWTPFLVCLVGGILGGSGVGSGINVSTSFINQMVEMDAPGGVIFVGILFWLAFVIFIANPVSVGISHYFVRAPYGERDFARLFSSFNNQRYLPIVKAMLLTKLFIFLWSLLFVIPGVIKSYQYRMVPYLMAEHPYLTPNQAMQLSKQMTEGHKMEMWILDLSFLGWLILGALVLGVGILFVLPYLEATWAQLYYVLRPQIQVPPPYYYNGQGY